LKSSHLANRISLIGSSGLPTCNGFIDFLLLYLPCKIGDYMTNWVSDCWFQSHKHNENQFSLESTWYVDISIAQNLCINTQDQTIIFWSFIFWTIWKALCLSSAAQTLCIRPWQNAFIWTFHV
jgi:hypothetical protein